eukprot:m51a1_g13722 hypothetical protein (175) ;mRNA; r:110061-110667
MPSMKLVVAVAVVCALALATCCCAEDIEEPAEPGLIENLYYWLCTSLACCKDTRERQIELAKTIFRYEAITSAKIEKRGSLMDAYITTKKHFDSIELPAALLLTLGVMCSVSLVLRLQARLERRSKTCEETQHEAVKHEGLVKSEYEAFSRAVAELQDNPEADSEDTPAPSAPQ